MKTQFRRSILLSLVALSILSTVLLFVPACNTTEGAGKDIESAGRGIKDSARENNNGN